MQWRSCPDLTTWQLWTNVLWYNATISAVSLANVLWQKSLFKKKNSRRSMVFSGRRSFISFAYVNKMKLMTYLLPYWLYWLQVLKLSEGGYWNSPKGVICGHRQLKYMDSECPNNVESERSHNLLFILLQLSMWGRKITILWPPFLRLCWGYNWWILTHIALTQRVFF